MKTYDLLVIGGGIVGAATAWQLQTHYPGKKILLLEKESQPALHQTGRNSGVVHAGVYYPADSLKAQFCKLGLAATQKFCQQNNLPYVRTGKLLVATNNQELDRMQGLYDRCEQNLLKPQILDAKQLRKHEPNVSGLGAILINDTAITDYTAITQTMLELFKQAGGQVAYSQQVNELTEQGNGLKITTADNHSYSVKYLVNCAGLMTDRIIKNLGINLDFQIIPFRGEYYRLPERFKQIVKHLIYPIPDPELPFLGVHLTRMIDGSVTVGPNAVLAMAREGYSKFNVNLRDIGEMLTFSGFWGLARQHAKSGVIEMKNSCFKSGYLQLVKKYCPQIGISDLLPYPSGIRAQAVSHNGELIHDFKFIESEHSLHIGNAPSPAATSAIPIAGYLIDKIKVKID